MKLSDDVKRLAERWDNNNGWPKRLEWLKIQGIRGWTGQRVDFNFPIVAIVGENGSGKSTILQAAAAIYRSPAGGRNRFPSDFFPDTAWEKQTGVDISFAVREGAVTRPGSVRKLTDRWRGNPERPQRSVLYFDLSRLQPVSTRVGYARIARAGARESRATAFAGDALQRLTAVLGKAYTAAKRATSSIDRTREVTVLSRNGAEYSGFHQGAGEMTTAELVSQDMPDTSLVLIDEIETSLHPRAQRRLIRDLAKLARLKQIQFIISTHSPYILEELPSRARLHVSNSEQGKIILTGVTSEYAMTKMDEVASHNVDVYVEDPAAQSLVEEILAKKLPDDYLTVRVSPCGPASVAQMLGQMVAANRFTRPTCVFLDGDQDPQVGCNVLPGGAAPERVIFDALIQANFAKLPERLARDYAAVADALNKAIAIPNHHG